MARVSDPPGFESFLTQTRRAGWAMSRENPSAFLLPLEENTPASSKPGTTLALSAVRPWMQGLNTWSRKLESELMVSIFYTHALTFSLGHVKTATEANPVWVKKGLSSTNE